MAELNYTDDELHNYRVGNYTVMTLLPIKFLHEQNVPVKDYAQFMGKVLAITWQKHKDAPLSTKAKLIATNYAAAGATNITYEEDDQGMTITIGNWLHPGFLQALGITKEQVDDFNFVWEPIGKFLEFNYEFEATETGYILKFTK